MGTSRFTFIDLFCGIGGMRLGLESAGCECLFSSDWDAPAQKTYAENFGERPCGDIRAIASSEIPDHDIFAAGFPCQPFSISGVSKKNSLGRAHGFRDQTQGTLFFEVKRIIRDRRPASFHSIASAFIWSDSGSLDISIGQFSRPARLLSRKFSKTRSIRNTP